MKIVFQIDQYLPDSSAPARRISGLAENLVKLGNEVSVVCPLPDYECGKRRKKWLTTFRKIEVINGVTVHRCFCVPFWNRGLIWRLLNQYSFRFSSRFASIKSIDALVVSTPPLISCKSAVKMAKKNNAKLVVDVRDIWPEVAIEMNAFSRNSLKAKMLSNLAEYLYKSADLVTTVSKLKVNTLEKRLSKYGKKALLISNGVDRFFINQEENKEFLEEFNFDNYFSVIHVGKIGNAQNLDALLDLAIYCRNKKDVKFYLIGDGVQLNHILNRISTEHIDNVVYCGVRTMKDCFTAYKHSKLSFVSLINDNLIDSVPTKLYETLYCGCPCLLSASGESADVVKSSKFGLVSSPSDLNALFHNFDKAYFEYSKLIENKNFCHNYIDKEFNRECASFILNEALKKI